MTLTISSKIIHPRILETLKHNRVDSTNLSNLTPFLINYGGDSSIPAEGKAVLLMAISMSLHYFAYSLARPTTLSLFVSSEIGFGKSAKSAFPFAMAFISPVSLLLLMYYGHELNTYGPMKALQHTTFFCSSMLIGCSALITFLKKNMENKILNIPLVKIVVGMYRNHFSCECDCSNR